MENSKEGYFQSISSARSIVPKNLRGPNNEWIAIAKRARVIFYNPDNVSSSAIKNLRYENLADKESKNKVLKHL